MKRCLSFFLSSYFLRFTFFVFRFAFLTSFMPHASHLTPHYSHFSASTGFLVAALQLCQLTVSNAIPNAIIPANAKIHQLRPVL